MLANDERRDTPGTHSTCGRCALPPSLYGFGPAHNSKSHCRVATQHALWAVVALCLYSACVAATKGSVDMWIMHLEVSRACAPCQQHGTCM
jgi:hypothetical protein